MHTSAETSSARGSAGSLPGADASASRSQSERCGCMRQVFLTNDNNASMTAEALPPTRGAVRRLIATACSTAPWRATAFMLLSFIFGLTYFVALVTAIAVGVGTLIIWIGIP